MELLLSTTAGIKVTRTNIFFIRSFAVYGINVLAGILGDALVDLFLHEILTGRGVFEHVGGS